MAKNVTKKQDNEEESLGKFILDVVIMMVVILGAFYLVFHFVLSNDEVSGPSMQPTFEDKDRLISVRNFTPKRNDVVVLLAPKAANDTPGAMYIKRVIGLPGDKIVSKNDKMYINGKRLAEPYLNNKYKKADNDAGHTYTTNFTYKVPKGYYWVMGDHRDISKDSHIFGPVKRENLVGKVTFRYWPFNKIQGF
ncbi:MULTISPECIES: signal peptidase I [Lactobacillus]|uniref:Signal peptidase I n=1 Tax=Lactobacillus apis TaxID=303541 RepID=A0A0F4LT23_9LACO|nr:MULTISPECIES: signal peptidase I [Lactobacillus]AWM73725.1 signal peptidase I [Lactobacillus apis]KJY61429.1 Signal peptidase I [Lactobacillus apis]MBH9985435.1 signal peptidase I [Lactobacillus sp. M0390]MBI0021940.1 signal peptidase I [Lactobacillus sp. W8172]MBI0092885.1 signal peptidase I [Lactobacillus sp. M0403]